MSQEKINEMIPTSSCVICNKVTMGLTCPECYTLEQERNYKEYLLEIYNE